MRGALLGFGVFAIFVAACSAGDTAEPATTVRPATSAPAAATTEPDLTTEPTVEATTAPDLTTEPTDEATTSPDVTTEPTDPAPSSSAVDGAIVPGPGELADRPCPPEFPPTARCSTLTVRADHHDPASAMITLPVTVLPARGPDPAPDPIVVPAGGPGYPGADDLSWATSPFIEQRDVVLYDQRGTGGAQPNLECPEVDAAFVDALRAAGPYVAERDAMAAGRAACLARLTAAGVDLADYHSEASAADLEALRQALGYDEWNLMGISYGARLALAAMRSHPEGIRAVILDSVYDVTRGGLADTIEGVEAAIARFLDGCAVDSTCASRYGDLAATLEQARQQYNASPAVVTADVGAGPEQFVITGNDLMSGLFNALYDDDLIPVLPGVITGLRDGDTAAIPVFVQDGVSFATGYADGMATAVNCADNAGLGHQAADAATFEEPGAFELIVAQTGACPAEISPTPGDFNAPVISELPALVMAGSYDPITPPAGTRAVADRLPNSTFLLVEPGGHGVSHHDDCVVGIGLAFLDDPATPPDTSCVDAIPPPAFG